jgi:steroid delta-isomerase-like uncharacterized protein
MELEIIVMNEVRGAAESVHSGSFSRRTAFLAGSIGLLAAPMTARSRGAWQEADLPEVVVAFLKGWKALDADQIAQTYAENGVREDVTTPIVIHGRDDVRRSLVAFLGAFSNAKVEHPVVFASPDGFAADTWVFTGSYTGALPGLPPGSGEPVTIHGFTLIEIADTSIRRTFDYYDAYGLMVQVGADTATVADDPATATPTD